jgi:hypothetical protein
MERTDTERFGELLDHGERLGARGLPFEELSELGRLYRVHVVRLARLRQDDDDPAAVRYLNALCVRAYTLLYVAPPGSRSFRRLVAHALPEALGRTWRTQAVAWSLLLLGTIIGFALAWRDAAALHALVPSGLGYSPEGLDRLVASAEARAAFLARTSMPGTLNLLFGSSLFVHNTRVGLLASRPACSAEYRPSCSTSTTAWFSARSARSSSRPAAARLPRLIRRTGSRS